MKLRDYFKQTDVVPTIYDPHAFGNRLSRGEIVGAITDAGYPEPTKDVLFYLVDVDKKAFLVRYFADMDKYGYEKLSMV